MAKDQQIDRYRKADALVRGVGGMTDAELYPRAVAAARVGRVSTLTSLCHECGCGMSQAARLIDLMIENRLGVERRSFRGSIFEYQEGMVDEVDYRGPRVQQTLPLDDHPPAGVPAETAACPTPDAGAADRGLTISRKDARKFAVHLRPVIDAIKPDEQAKRLSKSVLTGLYLRLTEEPVADVDARLPGLALSDTRF